MPRKNYTTVSISLNGEVFTRLHDYCLANRLNMSTFVAELCAPHQLTDATVLRVRARAHTVLSRLRAAAVHVERPTPIATLVKPPQGAVPVALAESTCSLVEDAAERLEVTPSRALDEALVRMLDAYEHVVASAQHCAVCRSKRGPFSPLLAGESVVARCADCARERRGLDGRRAA